MKILSSLGLLVGVIVGAGMFALPYVVVKAGLVWGSVHLVLAFLLLTFLHLLYGEVVFRTPGKHRLPGYARIYVGEGFSKLSLASAILGFNGALLAYGILGGIFLARLIGGGSAPLLTFGFFALGSVILALKLKNVGTINFVLVIPLILFVFALYILTFPSAYVSNIGAGESRYWFLPYGVFLFAFAGASAIPDVADVFKKRNEPLFQRVVVWGTLIPLILYALFIFSVAGVSGALTTPDAISGLARMVGPQALTVGALIGFLAVFTSFLSLGADLKNLYVYDYGWSPLASLTMVVLVPVGLFLLGASDFIWTIGAVGAVAIGIDGITIILLALAVRRRKLSRVFSSPPVLWLLASGLLAGIVYELVHFFA